MSGDRRRHPGLRAGAAKAADSSASPAFGAAGGPAPGERAAIPEVGQVIRRVAAHDPAIIPAVDGALRAAVAMVLSEAPPGLGEAGMIFIRRAQDPRDPWSGQMGFPGGRMEPEDAGPLETALRETREEIGIDLRSAARLIGPIDDLQAVARGKRLPLIIRPFLFLLRGAPREQLNHEVVETIWIPLSLIFDTERHERRPYTYQGVEITLPCFHFRGREVWGLTYRMLADLVRIVDPSRPLLPDVLRA